MNKKKAKKPKAINYSSSSSESDIESYLQKPEDLNLKSTFFQTAKSPLGKETQSQSDHPETKTNLSDSDSDDPLNIYVQKDTEPDPDLDEAVPSCSTATLETTETFNKLTKQAQELDEAKNQVEAYLARRKAENAKSADVEDLLAIGEKSFDLAKDLAEVGFHPSDFESGNESEKEDWEEVQESQERQIIPKDGVQITVETPSANKKKKGGVDLMEALKRRMNRRLRENQVYVHKVHLLCWIAHGNYVNTVVNREDIMGLALSLLPSKECYPPERTNLKYLEQITTWYHKAIKYKPQSQENAGDKDLGESLSRQIGEKIATSTNSFVYIFIAMLRSLGMQCRLVLSLQVEPLKPPASELCTLKNERKEIAEKGPKKEEKVQKKGVFPKKSPEVKKTSEKLTINSEKPKKEAKTVEKSIRESKTIDKTTMESNTVKKSERKRSKSVIEKKTTSENGSKSEIPPPKKSRISKSATDKEDNEKKTAKKDERTSKRSKSASQSSQTSGINRKIEGKTSSSSRSTKINLSKLKSTSTEDDDDFVKPLQNLNSSNSPIKTSCIVSKCVFNKSPIKTPRESSKSPVKHSKNRKIIETKTNARSKTTIFKDKSDKTKTDSLLRKEIDNITESLEELEKPQSSKSTKETINLRILKTKSKSVSSFSDTADEDDVFMDRDTWRASKSPRIESPKDANRNKIKKQEHSQRRTRSSSKRVSFGPLPEAEQGIDAQEIAPEPKVTKTSTRNRRPPVSQVDGQNDEDSEDSEMSGDSGDESNLSQLDGTDDNSGPAKSRSRPNLSSLKKSPQKHTLDVKQDIVNLVKSSIRNARSCKSKSKSYKASENSDNDSDSDFMPEISPKKTKPLPQPLGTKVKKRILPRKQLEALEKDKADGKRTKGVDIWVEVFLEEEEKWISADVIIGKVHCIKDIASKASHPISYILSWDNTNRVKDVTQRYCPNWNTVTRKLRIDTNWWTASLKSFEGRKSARDHEEDEDLAMQQLEQPLPKTITEYKDHPLYVLKRHLLKFQALYPPNLPVLGFIRNEEVYARECVHTLHSRDIWLKYAKVVRPGEQPYKIVKARPKFDKLSNTMITDQLLEIFGVWQVQDYDPPTAENGVVPRNAYGNVELFKPCMLPKKCVHLQLPGLNKVARKLNIDCAPAVVGFDFHGGWNHAVYDGVIVCEEFQEILIAAWEQEQDEIEKRQEEKYEKRVFGNWRRLIKAALIRERLKRRYNFTDKTQIQKALELHQAAHDEDEGQEVQEKSPETEKMPQKKKRPKFMNRK